MKRSNFNGQIAADYDNWYESKKGRFFDKLEKALILRLIKPNPGMKLLDIGCGTAHHIIWFKELRLKPAGVDGSPDMLDIARRKIGQGIELKLAAAENLPFADESFDIVTMITTLEFLAKPALALKEALRVSKDKVFLGVLNRYSVLSLKRRLKGLFKPSVYNQARFFSICQLMVLIKGLDKNLSVCWETTIPNSHGRNPFGVFIGVLIRKK
ncbi:MAG: methyltransferase domain-containing protein [Candidatus Omnitrophota bacterium]|nr:methyltransferase domain-containing protein [Candidatus Omnitrophota bacterium]